MTEYHKVGSLHNRNILSHCFGGQKSEIRVWAGLVPSEGYRETLFPVSLLASGSLLVIFDVPWLVDTSARSLLSFSRGVLPVHTSPSPNFPFL